jgi:hypothetical protein
MLRQEYLEEQKKKVSFFFLYSDKLLDWYLFFILIQGIEQKEFEEKRLAHLREAEERTAKKRAKR